MSQPKLTADEREKLLQASRAVAIAAYAPYSQFRVGAAVLSENQIYTGVNVENASYGLALCAERVALATAITQGERTIRAIAVACIDAPPNAEIGGLMPCGACRQWIAELAPQATILIHGSKQDFTLSDLLPYPFELSE